MAYAAGVIEVSDVGTFSVSINGTPASGGEGPYTYQWYRDVSPGFTPSGSNDLVGQTGLNLIDTTVLPGTQYYYTRVDTDTGNSDEEDQTNEVSVLTETGTQAQNKFSQSPIQGMLDLRFNGNTITAQIDSGQSGSVVASQAVMFTQDAGGVPKVEKCTANTDVVAGFVNYDVKSQSFEAGDIVEISMNGNVMYMVSTAAIDRGAKVMIVPATPGGVATATTGKPISGWAMDPASGAGELIRVFILTPSLTVA